MIKRPSPVGVEETTQRLVDAVTVAGTRIFATIDHTAGARSVGLEMPETRVLVLGNPPVGAPAMIAAPDLAVERPTRILVRETSPGSPGSLVVYHDPRAVARRQQLSTEQAAGLAGLAGIVGLVDRAIETRGT